MGKLTTDECRTILGDSATGKTDNQIAAMRDDLERVAESMYVMMTEQTGVGGRLPLGSRSVVDGMRWAAYMQEHPEEAE
jgi:hypothetical protein